MENTEEFITEKQRILSPTTLQNGKNYRIINIERRPTTAQNGKINIGSVPLQNNKGREALKLCKTDVGLQHRGSILK